MSDPRRPGNLPRRNTSRPRLRNQLLFVFGILLLAGGAFYTALVVATQIDHIFFPDREIKLGRLGNLPGIDKGSDSSDIGGGRINILVMGLDRRPTEGSGTPARTDTMFVVTVDPSSKTARGLALPRDLFVRIPGYYQERINAAFVIGETSRHPGGGPALAKATVENLLDVKIHYYVAIDFEGFKQIVDLLGGIDVEVVTPVNDPFYSDTERLGDYYPCVFDAGVHHMDGKDALCFARTRRNSSDLDRILRQQQIIFAVLDKASQLRVLSDPTNVVNLWKRYKGAVQTDINDLQIPGFARLGASIDTDRLAFISLGAYTSSYTTSAGAAVLIISEEAVKEVVAALFSDHRLQAENATIEVQNGTEREGHARKAVDYLAGLGIPVESMTATNASLSSYARTEIIDFANKRYTAERIAGWLGIPRDRIRSSGVDDAGLRTTDADIVVILGTDAKLESSTLLVSPPTRQD
jgi:polyisoprenyl-teichoic acid--peptidoglycan teichoic acid transferase